jgi:alanine dehydrogenase
VPTERKPGENRVALTPDGARELVTHGHRVVVESGAGAGSAITDGDFAAAGAEVVAGAGAWEAELVLKVKEPQPEEYGLLRSDLVLFTFLHLAAYPDLAEVLLASGATAAAERDRPGAPLLAPTSCGAVGSQIGAH